MYQFDVSPGDVFCALVLCTPLKFSIKMKPSCRYTSPVAPLGTAWKSC